MQKFTDQSQGSENVLKYFQIYQIFFKGSISGAGKIM